ncbi:hypothetical protein NXY00_18505 [Bacteroides sp. BFG-551]|nr:hypothetical protein [Bacteroides sp. BFG-551]
MMKKYIALFCVALMSGIVELNAQTDDAASAQHLILGQKASGASMMQSRSNLHPGRAMVPESRIRIVCTFGDGSRTWGNRFIMGDVCQ